MSITKAALLSALSQEMPHLFQKSGDQQFLMALEKTTEERQRSILADLLIQSDTVWDEHILRQIDTLYKEVSKDGSHIVSSKDIPVTINAKNANTRIGLFRGDITSLGLDAIVNAANEAGKGCYQPNHKCIDNIIHRRAGPRLRIECRECMIKRGEPLSAGSTPIVTKGYHLPSKHIMHVTGPQVHRGETVTEEHRELLLQTYINILETASSHSIKSIAIPCISTGLFGFPADEASQIAIMATTSWLEKNPSQLDLVVFDVFTDNDEKLYQQEIEGLVVGASLPQVQKQSSSGKMKDTTRVATSPRDLSLQVAKSYLAEADSVLIVAGAGAGAGMSVKEGEMVYTNVDDFARHYPYFPKYGYHTAYETMGVGGDPSIPDTVKWGLYANHMENMRWAFTPNEGYTQLRDMIGAKDYFVLTSNVDACFERGGFDASKIYTPQGEWTYMQCMQPCRHDSVFESRPYLDQMLPHIGEDGLVPAQMIPKCPNCGGRMFGNVRGGGWFLHTKYQDQNKRMQEWMASKVRSNETVAIVEVGAGFNTPTVTRFPAESFCRDLGERGRFIRINPSDPKVPSDLKAVSLAEGWQVLEDMDRVDGLGSISIDEASALLAHRQEASGVAESTHHTVTGYFGHFDWSRFLNQLCD